MYERRTPNTQPDWDMGNGRDARLVARAMRERWPIPEETKRQLLAQMPEVLRAAFEAAIASSDTEHKAKAAWSRVASLVAAMEKQNQDDEHLAQRLAAGQTEEQRGGGLVINIVEATPPNGDGNGTAGQTGGAAATPEGS